LDRADYRKIEKVDLPVDEIEHLLHAQHRRAGGYIFDIRSRPDDTIHRVGHAAWAAHPPKVWRVHPAGEVARADLNIRIRSDDRALSIRHISGEQHGIEFGSGIWFRHQVAPSSIKSRD
jgi:hypothetical protein